MAMATVRRVWILVDADSAASNLGWWAAALHLGLVSFNGFFNCCFFLLSNPLRKRMGSKRSKQPLRGSGYHPERTSEVYGSMLVDSSRVAASKKLGSHRGGSSPGMELAAVNESAKM